MNYRFRHLAAATAALTGVLMLLGIYTAASGAGLTCGRRWPLCNGAVFGLFPANWLSFVEWFHRLVAMVTGFVILGTTVAAWRRGRTSRVRWALVAAVALLPAQIALGALTVTEYEWAILTAHFVTALVIFTAVVLAAVWSFEDANPEGERRTAERRSDRERIRRTTTVALALFPAFAALTPRLFVVFSAPVQVTYYALGLGLYAALLAATLRAGRVAGSGIRLTAGVSTVLLFAVLVLGRQYGPMIDVAVLAGTLAAFAFAGGAAWFARGGRVGPPERGASGTDD